MCFVRISSLLLLGFYSAVSGTSLVAVQRLDTSSKTSFDVASIRPSMFAPGCYSQLPPGGTHYGVTCITLRELIAQAWKVHPDNITGSDLTELSVPYDISAVTSDGEKWNRENISPMLRQLLTERFHVAVHSGTRQISGYILIIAKGGSKLKPAKDGTVQQGHQAGQAFSNSIYPGYIRARSADLDTIASLLSAHLDVPVIDHTSLSGAFDIDLHYSIQDSTESDWPDFMIAVEQQLGLKLQPGKVSVNTLVINHADRSPTPN